MKPIKQRKTMTKNEYYVVKLVDETMVVDEVEQCADPDKSYQVLNIWDCKGFKTKREAQHEIRCMKETDRDPYCYGIVKVITDPYEDRERC